MHSSVYLRGVWGVLVHDWKSELDLLVFKITFVLNIEETSGQSEKVASRHKLLLRIISKKPNEFWVKDELNRFGVGQSISPIKEIYL